MAETNNFEPFFSVMEKKAGFIFGTGTERLLKMPLGVIMAGAGALYFGPKIIGGLATASQTKDANSSSNSLAEIEKANREMVAMMKAQTSAKPLGQRRDTYTYV